LSQDNEMQTGFKTMLFFLFVFTCLSLQAGELTGVGIKLGYNNSKFTGNDIPGKGVSFQSGGSIGGFIEKNFNHKYCFRQEALITLKGSKINTVGDVYLSNYLFYLEIPALLIRTFLAESKIRPEIFIGLAPGLKIAAFNDRALLEDIRSIDTGIVLGAGIYLWNADLDIRINRGLLNFDQSGDDIDLKNFTISFLIGFTIIDRR